MPRSTETALTTVTNDSRALVAPILAQLSSLDEDPTDRMMELMLNAASPAEWEQVFRSRGLKDSDGRRFRIHGARWSESQFEESRTGIFLVCDVTDLETGERDVLTVGADIPMAQVLNLVKTGNLPHDVQVVKKQTPTKNGYHPFHLVSLGRPVS